MTHREHLQSLADELGAELVLHEDGDVRHSYSAPAGWVPNGLYKFLYTERPADPSHPTKRTAHVYGFHGEDREYMIALHELGHIASGHNDSKAALAAYEARILEGEAEAWDWAIRHADGRVDPAVGRAAVRQGLTSYTGYPPSTAGPVYAAVVRWFTEPELAA